MEGHRGQAGTQISLAGEYQSTSARQLEKIKDEATSAAEWLVAHIQGRQEIQLEAVFRLCPKAVRAMQRDGTIAGVVIGIISSGTKPANIVLSPTRDRRLAYRRWVSSGEAGRLQGYAHSTTEAREPLANPTSDDGRLVDDGACIWGIYMIPQQLGLGAKTGELPRALCKPTSADGEVQALHSVVGALGQMAPEYTLWKLCASGSDANTFACLVRLALRCG